MKKGDWIIYDFMKTLSELAEDLKAEDHKTEKGGSGERRDQSDYRRRSDKRNNRDHS